MREIVNYCTLQINIEQSKALLDYFRSRESKVTCSGSPLTFSSSFKVKVRLLALDDQYAIFMLIGVSYHYVFFFF